jgi:hypothetical protein
VAVEIEPLLAEEAKERQQESTSKAGKTSAAKRQGNAQELFPARSDAGQARDQAAKLTGTNGRYVSDAQAVKAMAHELFEKVKDGKTSGGNAVRNDPWQRPSRCDDMRMADDRHAAA